MFNDWYPVFATDLPVTVVIHRERRPVEKSTASVLGYVGKQGTESVVSLDKLELAAVMLG